MRIYRLALIAVLCPALMYGQNSKPTVAEAQAFMDKVEAELLDVSNEAGRAAWMQETHITDDTEVISAKANERALTKTNEFVIAARRFDGLSMPPELARKFMLLKLNGSPTDPKLVAELTKVSAELDGMYGKGKYCRRGAAGAAPAGDGENCLGIDELDVLMAKSRDPKELEDLWVGWHKISPPMREKYTRLVELSNEGAKEFGFKDTGDLWRSGYDMTPAEFSAELERTWAQLEPLYKELHAYVRFKLVQKYGAAAERPDGMIPAHLLGNMWAQEWGNVYDIVAPPATGYKMYDLEAALRRQIVEKDPKTAAAFLPDCDGTNTSDKCAQPGANVRYNASLEAGKQMAKYGERFFTSLGFDPLPATFWERSQFVKPRDRDVVCHASAWNVDNDQDLRIKMCIKVDADNFTTVHHEEGHNFYQRAYRNQPFLFRNGANDGFHEAIGDSIALSITPDYLKQLKLIDEVPPAEADIRLQLRTALDKIAFLPFGLLIDKWRWEVFSGEVKPADYNRAWWELREKYQGVAPPVERTEADFDPGAKYHIPGNVPYARYFLARVYQFQFYKAMCDASGYKGPLNRCSFYGSKEAGAKLKAMLEAGQSKPWQETLKAMTGEDHLDAGPMMEYFAPLYEWLKQQNAANGVKVGWTAK
jgi:peptidyl-dipeptidase A